MNGSKDNGRVNDAKRKAKEAAGKTTGDKTTEHTGKGRKHRAKTGTVLGDINRDPEKADQNDSSPSDEHSGDARKHGKKRGAVLGELNDDATKKKD